MEENKIDTPEIEDRDIEVSDPKSMTGMEKILKNKLMLGGLGAVALIMMVSFMTTDNSGPIERREPPPPVTSMIPGDIRETDWISTAQAEIRAAREDMKLLTNENKELRDELVKKERENETMLQEVRRMAQEFEESNRRNADLIEKIENGQVLGPAPTIAPVQPPRIFPGNTPQEPVLPDGVVAPPRPVDLIDNANNGGNTVQIPRRPDDQPIPGRVVEPQAPRGSIVIKGRDMSAFDAGNEGFRTNEVVTKNTFAGYLPGGSFADVTLLSGAEVGTAEFTRANPQPFLMRVQTEAVTAGDGRYKMASCFVIGSGFGDLSSERAFVRVNRLICMDPKNKLVLETKIDGYIVDSDGTQGLFRDELLRRNGQLIAKALLAGFAEGIATVAQAASQSAAQTLTSPVGGNGLQQSTVDLDAGTLGEAGLFGGAANAASQLAELYIEEARNIFPVIRIDAGRKATMVILEGASLSWNTYEGLYTVKEEPVQSANTKESK